MTINPLGLLMNALSGIRQATVIGAVMSIVSSSVSCHHGKGFNCRSCWPTPRKYRLLDREFLVVASFPDTDEGTKQANAFMEQSQGNAGVLAVANGEIILAGMDDKGVQVATTGDRS